MATSKAFAYNPSLSPINGTESFDSLVVGVDNLDFSQNPGGIKWWGGPDEDLAYVIANVRPGGQPVPAGVTGGPAYVGFWKSKDMTTQSFLNMANHIGAQNGQAPFTSTGDAITWLNNNGYYTSFSASTPVAIYYVGGYFTGFTGTIQNSIVRLNSDGSNDTTFNPGNEIFGAPYNMTNYLNGNVIGVGQLGFSGGSQCIFMVDSQGNINNSFDVGTGFASGFFGDEYVMGLAIDSNDKILVGGYFGQYKGQTQNSMIRLNSDGSKDTSFNPLFPTTVLNSFQSVEAIAIDSNNKILAGGTFQTYNGSTQKFLVRLNSDGSKDNSFNIGAGFVGYGVSSIVIQSDGKILVGGAFTDFNGSSQNGLIRLNSDGSKDSSLNIGAGFNNTGVLCVGIQSDGKILVGGFFTEFNGGVQNYLIRLNSDGTKDNSFNIGTGFNQVVQSLKIDSDGKIVLVGAFTEYNGTSQNRIVRLNSDGSIDTSFNIGTGPEGNYPTLRSIIGIGGSV